MMADKAYKLKLQLSNGTEIDAGTFISPQGSMGPQGNDGVSVIINGNIYDTPADLPEFNTVDYGHGYIVKDGGGDANIYDLYIKNVGTADWTIILDWGGVPGITPHIGANGNWWIGDYDTGSPSRGEQGIQGIPGTNATEGTDVGLRFIQFEQSDWEQIETDTYQIVVTAAEHGMGASSGVLSFVDVVDQEGNAAPTGLTKTTSVNGTITLTSNTTFRGRLSVAGGIAQTTDVEITIGTI